MPQADTPKPIRVFLVDDHEVVRRGVASLLEDEDDLEVVGEHRGASAQPHPGGETGCSDS
jgi:DNA-binding NarL/FixJ family response regulator